MGEKELLSIFQMYHNTVYRIALSYLRSVPDAEDVVQTVFLKLIEKNPVLESGKERAWLTQVTVNVCKDLLKSSWRQKRDEWEESLCDTVAVMQEQESEVFYAVMQLPTKYRVVIHLHYYEGYTFVEIAKFLKVSVSAVSMRMHRARNLLKKNLKENCYEEFI
jgi:RNA polymerase sigma-70 factor (ECF subfamily)